MYYSKVAKSASIETRDIKEDAQSILDEVRLHGVYTAFSVNFETGDVEYISPRYSFKINTTTGDLEAEGESYTLEDEIGLIVNDWLIKKNVDINSLLKISGSHEKTIGTLKETSGNHTEKIKILEERITPIDKGGTGVSSWDAFTRLLSDNSFSRIEVKTYEGTGASGASNPNYIDFCVLPKCIVILGDGRGGYAMPGLCSYMMCNGVINGVSNYTNPISVSGIRVSWYNGENRADHQLNTSGATYTCVAFC